MTHPEKITEFWFLKVNYESLVDFCQTTDYLCCSLSFHNLPRYDCVIVNTTTGVFFAWLLFLFTCDINNTPYPIALVCPYDAPVGRHLQKDKHLKFWHVRSREMDSEFILAESIIQGVALTPDPTTVGDFLVMDTVDSDIFLCMKQMHLAAGHWSFNYVILDISPISQYHLILNGTSELHSWHLFIGTTTVFLHSHH